MKEQKIIKKVLEELGKEKPDLSYIKGLLEGLSEEYSVTLPIKPTLIENGTLKTNPNITPTTESKTEVKFEDMGSEMMKKVNFEALS